MNLIARSTARIAIVGLAFTAVAAPSFAQNLFPSTTGNYWKFKGNAGPTPMAMTYKVTSSNTVGGKTTAVFKMFNGEVEASSETYVIDKNGVSRVKSGKTGNDTLNPPIQIIKYPAKVGDSWNWKGNITTNGTPIEGEAKLKVAKIEEVVTAAGKYQAYRVDLSLTMHAQGQSIAIENSYWFAPNVGMVKQLVLMPNGKGGTFEVKAAVTEVKVK